MSHAKRKKKITIRTLYIMWLDHTCRDSWSFFGLVNVCRDSFVSGMLHLAYVPWRKSVVGVCDCVCVCAHRREARGFCSKTQGKREKSNVNTSCCTWMSHAANEWVMWGMSKVHHIQISHPQRKKIAAHMVEWNMDESRPMRIDRQNTYEWNMAHMNGWQHIWTSRGESYRKTERHLICMRCLDCTSYKWVTTNAPQKGTSFVWGASIAPHTNESQQMHLRKAPHLYEVPHLYCICMRCLNCTSYKWVTTKAPQKGTSYKWVTTQMYE